VGTEIILKRFGAADVHAFDLDRDMVRRARQRLAAYPPGRVTLYQADVTAIPEPDAGFDAVFDFGIIHHVPAWRVAVADIHRVLRPGGRFYFEEVTRQALERWFYRTFLDHPSEDRFSAEEFVATLEAQGIVVGKGYLTRFFGDFVLGVGRKPR
jgi:ubiquinone/menaquinone biosynthesis C-methylase UbiE